MRIKHIFTFFTVLTNLALYGQPGRHSTITGQLKFIQEQNRVLEVTYRKIAGGYQFDSAIVTNGKFKINKEINEPVIAILSLKQLPGASRVATGPPDYISLFLVPDKDIQLNSVSSLRGATVSGSGAAVNKEYQELLTQSDAYIQAYNNALSGVKGSGLDSAARSKWVTALQDSINLERDKNVYLRFLKNKPKSPVGVLALLSYAGEPVWRPRKKIAPDEIEQLLAGVPKKFLSYPALISLKEELQVSKATGYGKPIINFSLEDTAGKKVSLSDFKGQYVFLDFWASWCVPCRKENPNVIRQFEKYKDRGFTVVSVSLDKPDARQAWIDAIHKDGIGRWTHLGDLHGFDGPVAKSYYVKSIPTNFLIAPDGTFLARNLYGEQLEKELSKIFSK